MKNVYYYIVTLAVACIISACASTPNPEIVISKGPDNPVVMKMKYDISTGAHIPASNSWLWWYAPVACIAVMWTVKYLFFRKCVEEDIDVISENNTDVDKKANNESKN